MRRGLVACIALTFALWAGLQPLVPSWAGFDAMAAEAGPSSEHLGQTTYQACQDLTLEDDATPVAVLAKRGEFQPSLALNLTAAPYGRLTPLALAHGPSTPRAPPLTLS